MRARIAIAGAGFSGATVARCLADAGVAVTVFDPRDHVAGNCHTARDARTGILVHEYGPHIFHTDDDEVWRFVQQYGVFAPFRHSVVAQTQGQCFALPINLGTINQVFGANFSPAEARAHLATITHRHTAPRTFEEQALSMMGERIYNLFFRDYTRKQWGREPSELPASILKRLPMRFSYDDTYFNHGYQGLPIKGYTAVVRAMLDHPLIELRLNTAFDPREAQDWAHVFWTGPLDGFFEHRFGRLSYRTLNFERQYAQGDAQGCAVMNYCDADVPWTRITEHKHFAPWENHDETVLFRETSREAGAGDIPYYPVRLAEDKLQLKRYQDLSERTPGVTFLGRLGTYRYLDMDVSIREAIDAARAFLAQRHVPAAQTVHERAYI